MGRGGFEPPKQVAADLQSVPFGHSGICPYIQKWDLQGSNLWPSACKADALPAELRSHKRPRRDSNPRPPPWQGGALTNWATRPYINGDGEIRTLDPLLARQVLSQLSYAPKERVMGIEPTYPAWKAGVLPLNYTRKIRISDAYTSLHIKYIHTFKISYWKTCSSWG